MRSFFAARQGNVGIMFSLAVLPMLALAGLGIDYSRALNVRTTLNAAADAAALAGATEAETILQSIYGVGPTGVVYAQQGGKQAAQQVFATNGARIGGWVQGGTPTPTVTVTPTQSQITATVAYQAPVPTMFGKMFGTPTFTVSGSASSQLTMPKFVNISVLTDISQSMGLAANSTGMTALQNLTPNDCAFGCHVVSAGQMGYGAPWTTTSYETIAHQNNIQLRIDVIRQATQNMIQTAQQMALSPPMISFGLYTLQAASPAQGLAGPAFGTLSPPSTSYPTLLTAANNIDLGMNNSAGIGDTDDATAMNAITALIPANGTGLIGSPLQYLFLMTDGVQDVFCNGGYGSHCTQAFDPSLCSTLKTNGVTVGVIYTTYLQMPTRPEYQALVASFVNNIGPNLKSCASPGWYYEASDDTDIQNAINALFAKAVGRGVLTQ